MRRAEDAVEMLDRVVPAPDRAASLADVERLNAWFGGYALTLRALARLARRVPTTRALVVADVGGAAGALARRVAAWARRQGRPARVVVLDRDLATLTSARAGAPAGVVFVCADATALPLRAASVDVAVTALTLHHLDPEAAVACLAGMRSAARAGVIVNDLLRARLSLALVWLATRLVARHRFSRHDGPLSVRRAYSPAELAALGARAGLRALRVRAYPLLGRVLAVGE
ncbi:MAG: methyltransferase domain-containing protein [Candidatus Rokubacteria bacterium]|nr:methyltransferase domain-containing protein [Candidatus Rokubacteria bacterium]